MQQDLLQFFFLYFRYLIRPSPFSAHKTFERHNSRRRSHINICDLERRRRSSATCTGVKSFGPPQKANSLSLPESPDISFGVPTSPSVLGANRGRSHSLRVDDILLRRSNSLRHGLMHRNTSSVEEVSPSMESSALFFGGNRTGPRGSIKIPLNGSIDLEVTPPTEHNNVGQESPPPPPALAVVASSTSNDRFVLQYSDSEDSLDFRGTIV